MSTLHPSTHKVLMDAWRENRLAAVHIDLQPRFAPSPELCDAVRTLSRSLRSLNVENIWVAYASLYMEVRNGQTNVKDMKPEGWTGHNIMDGVGAYKDDTVIIKAHDSAFYSPSWPLHTHLQAGDKDTLLITGLHHDYCVGDTIKDGILSNHYNIIAVGDCINIPEQTNAGYHYYARWIAHGCHKREEEMRVYNVPRQQINQHYQNRFHIATSDLVIDALTP